MLKRLISITIIVIVIILLFDITENEKDILLNKIETVNYIEGKKPYDNQDIAIEIPKINIKSIVKEEIKNFSNLNNNLIYYDNGNTTFIFGHSGLGYGTYFNRLDELSVNDLLYFYKDKNKQVYIVNKIFYIDEENTSILNIKNKKELYLITCKKGDNKKRLVVKLVKKQAKNTKNR